MKTIDTIVHNKADRPKLYSNSIMALARHTMFVHSSAKVIETADALQNYPDIPVFGVVDSEDKLIGIIEKESLFVTIGKPFGREVLRRTSIMEFVQRIPAFDYRTDFITVFDKLQKNPELNAASFIPVIDEQQRFAGIFSRYELNEFLANITKNDIDTAGKLQERLLAFSEYEKKCYSIYAWSQSARSIGGDLFFIHPLPNDCIFSCLCDVSGKGVSASVIVSMIWGMLLTYDYSKSLSELIVLLNRAIITTFHMEKYLTGFFMTYNPHTRRIICADMGHSHALLIRNKKVLPIRAKNENLPIGIELEMRPYVFSFQLHKNDILMLYTDGIPEQHDESGNEFGEENLIKLIHEHSHSLESLRDSIISAIELHKNNVPQQDDMSLLIFGVS